MASTSDLQVELCCMSDPGQEPTKQVNEDAARTQVTPVGQLALVCDGMGGHAHGQAASQAAVATITEYLQRTTGQTPQQALLGAIQAANEVVYQQGGGPGVAARPGSTCVALLLHRAGAEIAHVGDSRLYLIRKNQIFRMTRDHSVVQQMLDAGLITPEEAVEHPDSNRITRALGMAPSVEVELRQTPFALEAGDVFLLASDGLTDLVTDPEILSIYTNRSPAGLGTACKALVDMANLRGGHDNITVLLARLAPATALGAERPNPETAFGGPRTVVDNRAETLVDRSPPTLVSPAEEQAPSGGRTEPELAAPSGHHFQDGNFQHGSALDPARDTEPGPGTPPTSESSLANQGFVSDYPGGAAKSNRKGKILLLLAAAFTVFIVGAIFLWWLVATLFSAAPGAPSFSHVSIIANFESGLS